MIELPLVKLLSDKKNYDEYISLIHLDLLDIEIRNILMNFEYYFKEFDVTNIDFSKYFVWFYQCKYPDLSKNQYEFYKMLFKKLIELNVESGEEILLQFKAKQLQRSLITTTDSELDINVLKDKLKEYEKELENFKSGEEPNFIVNDLERITTSNMRNKGLQWKLSCLQNAIGFIIKGDFIIIAAYVNVGKTTFAVSEAIHMAKQLEDGNVLWLNNEEFNDRVIQKFWTSALKSTWDVIVKYKERAKIAYKKLMNGDLNRIQLIDIRSLTLTDIKKIIEKMKPKLIIVDQIDKINVVKKKFWSDHDRLKYLYGQFRELANEYCPIMVLSQADATTRWLNRETGNMHYKRYLDQSQLDGSKVGKPGEADFIITIGKDIEFPNSRFINVTKNKLRASDYKAEVNFYPERASYED